MKQDIGIVALVSALIAFGWLTNVLVRKAFVFGFFGEEFDIKRDKKPIAYWTGIGFISLFGSLTALAAFGKI